MAKQAGKQSIYRPCGQQIRSNGTRLMYGYALMHALDHLTGIDGGVVDERTSI
jgi:hypothetical protein